MSWPKDKSKAKEFQNLYIETMIQFAYDFYKESEKIALKNGHDVIQESDVYELIQIFLPHEINEYEDAVFFPRLASSEKINIESYDMDAFRDSGLHWRYLEYALASHFHQLLHHIVAKLVVDQLTQASPDGLEYALPH